MFWQIVLIQFNMLLPRVAYLASLLLLIILVAKVSRMQHVPMFSLIQLTTLCNCLKSQVNSRKECAYRFWNRVLWRNQDLLVHAAWEAALSAVHTWRKKNTDDATTVCTTYWLIMNICFLMSYLPLPPSILHWPVSESGHWMRRIQNSETRSDPAWIWLYSNMLWAKQPDELKILLVKVNNSLYLNW